MNTIIDSQCVSCKQLSDHSDHMKKTKKRLDKKKKGEEKQEGNLYDFDETIKLLEELKEKGESNATFMITTDSSSSSENSD